MTSNTVLDFLKTAESEDNYITCPACGSPIGIRTQGYEMILTDNLRLELDGNIAALRLFLERLETKLEQRNLLLKPSTDGRYPYSQERNFFSDDKTVDIDDEDEENNDEIQNQRELSHRGMYRGILGKDAAENFVENKLDFFEQIRNYDKFPLKTETNQEILDQECKSLLRGIEPRSLIGTLMDLIFDQRNVFKWMKEIEHDPERKKLKELLDEVCPTIQWYLQKLEELHSKRKDDEGLLRAIIRGQFVLAIVLGHKSKKCDFYGLKEISIDHNVPFTLPRQTIISYRNLLDILHSEVVLGNPKLRLSDNFQKLLKSSKEKVSKQQSAQKVSNIPQAATKPNSEDQLEDLVRKLVQQWGKEIYKLVNFSCTGPSGEENKRCGWYPKETETHSIILLGSPGTGKSCVLLTGLVSFFDHVQVLGATVALDLPDDRERLQKLEKDYRNGLIPSPTKTGSKTSIKLSVQFPEIDSTNFNKTHFVFTDIAGEDVARSLTEEGSQPWVLRILKNANTIIFFFDLSIEPTIREKLTKTRNAEIWKPVSENYEVVNKSREGNAAVNQLYLLEQIIGDLETQRGDLSGINFICVIPKSDLYAKKDGEQDRLFFNSFYEKMIGQGIFVPSNFDKLDDESFDGFCSLGGTSYNFKSKDNKETSANKSKVLQQKNIGRMMSDEVRKCLLNMGNALGEDAVPAFKESLKQLAEVRLMQRLEATLGKDSVYYLAVSALGKNPSKIQQEGKSQIDGVFNQKLSEYVFILPIALAVANGISKPQQP
jgi:Double-GTPase 1